MTVSEYNVGDKCSEGNNPEETTRPMQAISINQLLRSVKSPSNTPTVVISSVHDQANKEYRIVKGKKQEELRYKVIEAQKIGDKAIIKTQKKRNDNHASAVASRAKQEIIIKLFEDSLQTTMSDRLQLANAYIAQGTVLKACEEKIRDLKRYISFLERKNEQLSRRFSTPNNLPTPDTNVIDPSSLEDNATSINQFNHQQSSSYGDLELPPSCVPGYLFSNDFDINNDGVPLDQLAPMPNTSNDLLFKGLDLNSVDPSLLYQVPTSGLFARIKDTQKDDANIPAA